MEEMSYVYAGPFDKAEDAGRQPVFLSLREATTLTGDGVVLEFVDKSGTPVRRGGLLVVCLVSGRMQKLGNFNQTLARELGIKLDARGAIQQAVGRRLDNA
jgi:hypothetical protein